MAEPKTNAAASPESVVDVAAQNVPTADWEYVAIEGMETLPVVTPVVDWKQCPKGFVPMFFAGNMRIALTSGRVYVFAAGKPQFVQLDDRDAVAARGGAEFKG